MFTSAVLLFLGDGKGHSKKDQIKYIFGGMFIDILIIVFIISYEMGKHQ